MAAHPEDLENGQYLPMNISFPLAQKFRPVKMMGQIVRASGLGEDFGWGALRDQRSRTQSIY
jgi:hypothetical protein